MQNKNAVKNQVIMKFFQDLHLVKTQGFTLIELLVVVLIIGILAAVAVPQYQKAVLKSRFATIKNLVQSLAQAEGVYYLSNGNYTSDISKLDIDVPAPSSSTVGQYIYPWGECILELQNGVHGQSAAYCFLSDQDGKRIIGYLVNYSTNKLACYAYNSNKLAHSICQAETGQITPIANIRYEY